MKMIPIAVVFGLVACPLVASAEDATFNSKGVKIRYVTEGKGEPVVLIHGWMSDSSFWGRDAAGNTKLNTKGMDGFQIIAIDCRGHGKSDGPHDPKKYGAEMAEDVIRLLDHLKLKKAHLVGYSMGAFIAGKVAAKYPQRVLSAFYGGQAPILDSAPDGSSEVDAFERAVKAGKGFGSYLIEVMPAGWPKPTIEAANSITKNMFAGKDTHALLAAGKGFDGLKVKLSDLQKCKAPSMFLYGSKEPESLKTRVAFLRGKLANTSLVEVNGGDHSSTLFKPEFGKSIVDFIIKNRVSKL